MPTFRELVALSTADNAVAIDVPDFQLFAAGGCRWLCSSPGAIQTAIDLADPACLLLPTHRAMALGCFFPEWLHSVLDLGTGGGALLRYLQAFQSTPQITTVEADPRMLILAREWFCLPQQQPVVIADAATHLARNKQVFDLVLCDVFTDRSGMPALQDEAFFRDLRRAVDYEGAAVINLLPESDAALREVLVAASRYFPWRALYPVVPLGNVLLFLTPERFPDATELNSRLAAAKAADGLELGEVVDGLKRL